MIHLKFPFGMAHFRGKTVSFREGNQTLSLELVKSDPRIYSETFGTVTHAVVNQWGRVGIVNHQH